MQCWLNLEDCAIDDSTRSRGKPALFRLGDGSLSAPLEEQLLCLHAGDTCTFTLPPQASFGAENPNIIQFFSPRHFTEIGEPEAGTIMLFTAFDGIEMPGVVRAVVKIRAALISIIHWQATQ